MKKLTFLALSLVGVSLLTACSSYTNGNELEEEDKYIRPEGVHELADFLTQFDTKYTMITTLNNNVSIVNVDGTIKKSVVDGVEYYEELDDTRYYLYDQSYNTYSIYIESQLQIPFDFLDVKFSDFIEFEESYTLSAEKSLEFNIDSLTVTYDKIMSNILFTTSKDDCIYESFISSGVDLKIPQQTFELKLHGLDEITNFLVDSNYDNYSVITDRTKTSRTELYYSYHTAEYSDYIYFDNNLLIFLWHVILYDNGVPSLISSEYTIEEARIIQVDSFVTLNMFVCDSSDDLYEKLLMSSYDSETNTYIYSSNEEYETFIFNEDYNEIYYDDYNDLRFRHTLYNFGTTTIDDFMHSIPDVSTLGYTNLIK